MNRNITVALAGNPNVGKSTIFNALTGMKQHTGNWAGKTVENAKGYRQTRKYNYTFVDIPGTYSLLAHSPEEEIARNYLCFKNPDIVVVVCDATCIERNLNLVLQTMEICKNVVVCVNLLDQACKKKIIVDLKTLQKMLGVPVIGTIGHNKRSILKLLDTLDKVAETPKKDYLKIEYPYSLENAVNNLAKEIEHNLTKDANPRWVALKLLESNFQSEQINSLLKPKFFENNTLIAHDFDLNIMVTTTIFSKAENIAKCSVKTLEKKRNLDRKLDNILTSKTFGIPVMLLFLGLIFWITISGANYPSQLLSQFFSYLETKLTALFLYFQAPDWLHDCLINGVWRTLSWVVSVMLPPMAIFFPLFTLLEDLGYLPRIAFNLDKPFKKCNACGKQALTMCMGFGCNAVGVTGCRIIDSKRERLLAILTNNLVPCNGRFPTIIALISMFLVFGSASDFLSALILTAIILLGICTTFFVTKLLSLTVLKGEQSSYTLELPPYRKPQYTKVIIRSVFDRTLFVLGRSIIVAAPVGFIIWAMANIYIGDTSLLLYAAEILDPFAQLLGLDGVILLAFILGSPANEIVLPIIIMGYMNTGKLVETGSLSSLRELLIANGWTANTAISVILFSLFHWPCATTIMTIKKETKSIKWTALSVLLPTILSISVCMLFNLIVNLI